MLVLSRKVGQSILIQGNIRIRVNAIRQNTVQLGITAPPEVNIVREEIVEKAAARPATRPKKPRATS